MSERVIIVEMKDGKREGYVIEWGTQDSLRHFSTGEWMIFDKWKMIRTEDVKSLTLLPEDVEDEPKPFISGGYVNAKALTELRADEQVINFEKIKEEALRQYGKELEKDVAKLAKETHEKFAKEERDAFIESIKPKGYKNGGVIGAFEDEPQQVKLNGNGFEVTGTGADFEQWIGELIDKKLEEKEEERQKKVDAMIANVDPEVKFLNGSVNTIDTRNLYTDNIDGPVECPCMSLEELIEESTERIIQKIEGVNKSEEVQLVDPSAPWRALKILGGSLKELEERTNQINEGVEDDPEDMDFDEEVEKIAEEVFEKKFKEKQRLQHLKEIPFSRNHD